MTPKDNNKLTLSAYSDYLEENNKLELAEEIRKEITESGGIWWYIELKGCGVGGLMLGVGGTCQDIVGADYSHNRGGRRVGSNFDRTVGGARFVGIGAD